MANDAGRYSITAKGAALVRSGHLDNMDAFSAGWDARQSQVDALAMALLPLALLSRRESFDPASVLLVVVAATEGHIARARLALENLDDD